MRKLRQAVVVGAMLGSITMLGAGVASADDTTETAAPQGVTSTEGTTAAPQSAPKGKHHDKGDKITTVVECEQAIDNSVDRRQYGLVNLGDITVPILGSGNADSTSNQNICGIGNDENSSESEAETENEGDLLDLF
ncbi:hypothetical protein OG946_19315 [Streptomyces sp. NBC_01808]|uniref:hypothetical protein n=1 Tax=Streptomyces sp. NBC_01808 TaxID=2975947 RepID=UPI002DDA9A1B|nr:hypothetical protein [Streptomyces sp. NBC_01808]WSA39320.1 hypothetical protein OG946_19315 [Streptomyces sp. NBC_01808]